MTDPYVPLSIEGLSFEPKGHFLNSAYTHPMSTEALGAVQEYLRLRREDVFACSPIVATAREAALEAFARLHGCDVTALAFVPSTMAGENIVAQGLGLSEGRGRVVTDSGHFAGSLFLYHELRRRGLDAEMVQPAQGESMLEAYARAIVPGTTLVAVSAISATSGYIHDLKALCEIAHARGALVYADLIQAAGAVPLDLAGCGVDFAASATYKWLLGDFGIGIFYARPESLQRLGSHQLGYRQMASYHSYFLPHDPVSEALSGTAWPLEAESGATTEAVAEVGTQAHAAIVALGASLPALARVGLEAVRAHRQPLLRRLAEELPRLGFAPMVSAEEALRAEGSIGAYVYPDAAQFSDRLAARGVNITVYKNRIRVSPSMFNSMHDIDALLEALR